MSTIHSLLKRMRTRRGLPSILVGPVVESCFAMEFRREAVAFNSDVNLTRICEDILCDWQLKRGIRRYCCLEGTWWHGKRNPCNQDKTAVLCGQFPELLVRFVNFGSRKWQCKVPIQGWAAKQDEPEVVSLKDEDVGPLLELIRDARLELVTYIRRCPVIIRIELCCSPELQFLF